MAVFSKYNFAHAGPITLSIIDDLLANGFKAIFPVSATPPNNFQRPTNMENFTVTLEAQEAVDPLNPETGDKQPWRINFTVYNNACMGIVAGSDYSLKDDGTLPFTLREGADGKTYFGSPSGVVGSPYLEEMNYTEYSANDFATCLRWVAPNTNVLCSALPTKYRTTGPTADYTAGQGNPILANPNAVFAYNANPSCFERGAANTGLATSFQPNNATKWKNEYENSSAYPSYCLEKDWTHTYVNATDKDLIKPMYGRSEQGFINRAHRMWQGAPIQMAQDSTGTRVKWPEYPGEEKDLSSTYPMSYHLVISDHGIFLAIWEGTIADASGRNFSWVAIQRPVDRDNGNTIVTGKAPVFCANSVGNKILRFVVREADRVDATLPISAVADGPDYSAIINDKIQVGVSEDNTYVVNFPSRLNTPRYAYTYELDMIGYTAATVVANETDIPVKIYGEQDDRIYFGMFANQPDNNGMRIVALHTGGGV